MHPMASSTARGYCVIFEPRPAVDGGISPVLDGYVVEAIRAMPSRREWSLRRSTKEATMDTAREW